MKLIWMALAIGLTFSASPAAASDMKLDLNIPEVNVEALQGNNNAVALWVKDGRQEKALGNNLQGDKLVLRSDIAADVTASFSSALRSSGFRLEPYRADAPVAMLIRIQSLTFTAEKNMITNSARLSCKLVATLSRNGTMVKERTIGTSGEYTLTLWASKEKISELVSETLGDTISALLQDADTTTFLKKTPQAAPK
jgi:uncharacterized lipoprotein YajG